VANLRWIKELWQNYILRFWVKFFCYISHNAGVLLINCENHIKEMAEHEKFVLTFYESG
jgi:hypothetical protein